MRREEFKEFVDKTLEDVICIAEEKTGQKLSRKTCFYWLGHESERVCEGIAEHITKRLYIDEGHIYPCVDIGVTDIMDDRTTVITASVAGYSPRPFAENWTRRDGPFVYVIGQKVLDKLGCI